MHITKISGRSLKGGDFDITLAPANVITGENFTGKTRITDAVRLLLLGYLPELGKLPRSTFGLSSGQILTVCGEFSDGTVMEHKWTAKGDSVKYEAPIVPLGLEGAQPLLAVMLNAEEYFALTDRQRVEYVFANCPLEKSFTREEIIGRIAQAAPGYEFAPFYQDIDASEPALPNEQAVIEKLIEFVADEWRSCKEQAKRMDETARGLTSLRAADAQARPLAAAEDAKRALELALADLNDRKLRLNASYSAMHVARLRRQEIARELGMKDKNVAEEARIKEKLLTLNRELTSLLPEPDLGALASYAQKAQADLKAAGDAIEKNAADQREAEAALAELDAETMCPHCGAAGDGWKAQRKAELEAKVNAVQILTQPRCMREFKVAQSELERRQAHYKSGREIRARIEHLKSEEVFGLEQLRKITPLLERVTMLEQERDRLPELNPETETQMSLIQSEIQVRTAEGRQLDEEIKLAVGRAHDLKRLAEAEKTREQAVKNQEGAAAAGKTLRAIQGEMVEAAFRPLLATANAIFATALPAPLAYHNGEIGSWRNSVWVGHGTMSGTEKLLGYGAIQAALAARSPVRLLILDEMGRLTHGRARMAAIDLLNAIKAGLLDQVICIDPERPDLYLHIGAEHSAFNVIPVS